MGTDIGLSRYSVKAKKGTPRTATKAIEQADKKVNMINKQMNK